VAQKTDEGAYWAPRLRRNPLQIDRVALLPDRESAEFVGYARLRGVVWRIHGVIRRRRADGVAVATEVRVVAVDPPDAAITASRLAELPVRDLTTKALARLEEDVGLDTYAKAAGLPGAIFARDDLVPLRALTAPTVPARGNRGAGPSFYAGVAFEAVGLAERSLPVIRELANRRGRHEQTVKAWIRAARKAGILDPRPGVWQLGPSYPTQHEEES
jgi:hypothetical protein